MKRLFLGVFVAILRFAIGFLRAPIRFVPQGSGIGATPDLKHTCHFVPYESSYLERVVLWFCVYDNEAEALQALAQEGENYHTLSSTERRLVVSYSVDGEIGYCLLRADGRRVTSICSRSFRHIFALEQQKNAEGLFNGY